MVTAWKLAHADGSSISLQVHALLPSVSPCLPRLRTLVLGGMHLQDFPISVAGALKRLISLDLRCNDFGQLPAAVSRITTLESLDISSNNFLELEDGDLNTLAALPDLQILSIFKAYPSLSKSGYSQKSVWVLMDISRRFPHLKLPPTPLGL
jgi:hypothetical protein